jgi:hypothetical protein
LGYVTLTIRVPEHAVHQAREVAKISEWHLADFLRTLICLGAVFFLLSFDSEERLGAATVLPGDLDLLKLSRSFSLRFSKRRYKFRTPGRKSKLVTIRLPRGIHQMAASYAERMKVSRNEVYSKSIQQGLLIYLKAHTTIQQPPKN